MKNQISKSQAEKNVKDFFKIIKNKPPKQVKKIKKLAMRYNIKLGNLRRKFCKKCLTLYVNPKIRVRNKIKSTTCKNCGYVSRWKINSS